MGRQRMVKPDFWTSEQVMALPRDARLFFIGLWNFSDDAGRFRWAPETLRVRIVPSDTDVNAQTVQLWLSLIAQQGLVERYRSATGDHIGLVTGWHHQKISNPTPSKLPDPKACARVDADGSTAVEPAPPQVLPEASLPIKIREDKRREEREETRAAARSDNGLSLPNGPIGPGAEFGAEAMRRLFAEMFRQLRHDEPKLTGKGTDTLHERVLESARGRGVDPRALFVARAHRWLGKELKGIELAAPYACFAAEWSALGDSAAPSDGGKTELFRKSMDALKRNDHETYERLNRELEELEATRATG